MYKSTDIKGRESGSKEIQREIRSFFVVFFLPEIAPKVGNNVAMFTFFNHKYFLLNQRKIIS